MITQLEINLPVFPRGFHLITELVTHQLPVLPQIGVFHLFIKHTSAALTVNENADPSVRVDFESSINNIVKECEPFYTHTHEGDDDMPAHIKTALIGESISIPITNGQLNLGAWQGIYLCEFRNQAGSRTVVGTVHG